MATTSITSRDFYNAVIEAANSLDGAATFGSLHMDAADLQRYAEEAIAKIDTKNELRRSKPSKASQEAAGRKLTVLSVLSYETYRNRDEVAEEAGCTPGQATAALTALVKEGLAERIEGKGKGGKTTYCRVFIED